MSAAPSFKLLTVGVGGQGVLSVARALGAAAMDAGLGVRVGQLHGLAQRGGCVEATLLIGAGQSSFISAREADVVLALEPLEAQRAIPRMSGHTVVVTNPVRIVPYALTSRGESGPSLESILEEIRKVTPHVFTVDGSRAAREAGSPLSLNIAMAGALVGRNLLPIPMRFLTAVLERFGRSVLREANLRAFHEGRRLGAAAGAPAPIG